MRATGFLLALSLFAHAQDGDDGETSIEVAKPGDPAAEEEEEEEEAPAKAAPERKTPPPPGRRGQALFQDGAGKLRIELPDDWNAEPAEAKAPAVLAFDLELPGGGAARLAVERREEMGDPRAAPRRWGNKEKKKEIAYRPVPMFVEENGARRFAVAFRKFRGNGFLFSFDCAAEDFAAARPAFVAAALSFEADVARFPAIPDAYSLQPKGRFLFAVHPSVKGSIRTVQRLVAAQEKSFARVHGGLPSYDKEERPVVFVHSDRFEAKPLNEQAAEHEFVVDWTHGRLFAIQVPEDNRERAAGLCWATQGLCFLLQYGDSEPGWAYSGECAVAQGESYTTKPLPDLAHGMIQSFDNLRLETLDGLPALREKDEKEYSRQAFAYGCFFRAGPATYRKAYRGYLKEFRETGDPVAAWARHMEPLDQDDIRSAADRFIHRDLRPYHPK